MENNIKLIIFDASGTIYSLSSGEVFNEFIIFANKAKLSGIKLALATNLGRSSTKALLEKPELSGVFECVKCADDAAMKPCGEMLELIIEDVFEIPKEQALMIGDSISDIEAAKNAKIKSAFAMWDDSQNWSDFKHNNIADFTLKSFEMLTKLLRM